MYPNQRVIDAMPEATGALLEIAGPATLGEVLTHLLRQGYDAEDTYIDTGLLELLEDGF